MQIKTKSFTLIELLIVIVIIGILAVAMIPRLKWAQDQARVRAANVQMQDFNTALMMARVNSFKTLKDITWNWCSNCACRTSAPYNAPVSLRGLDYNHPCRANRRNVLTKVAVAAGMDTGALLSMELDPWGAPYEIDENEWEFSATDCRVDSFFSTWPDATLWWNDNIFMNTAPVFCPGAY